MFLAPEPEDGPDARHVLINHPGWLDRSPGGTGTSALMAVRHARGQLGLNTDFVEETHVGDHVAVVPTITGRAWLTATSQFMLDPSDPFPAGFTL